jgi:creatinine amidohydrolase
LEAFPFTKVSPLPEEKKQFPHVPGIVSTESLKDIYGDGSFGGEYSVSRAIIDELFQAALEDILAKLRFLQQGT